MFTKFNDNSLIIDGEINENFLSVLYHVYCSLYRMIFDDFSVNFEPILQGAS